MLLPLGNPNLVAPFVYRPVPPLLVGALARALGVGPEAAFRLSAHLMCVAFIVGCALFGRAVGASRQAAILTAVALALYLLIVKWNVFSGTMVDIFAYPLVLLAFLALPRRSFYVCLAVSAVGLFFKEFLLLPLLTQAAVLVVARRR